MSEQGGNLADDLIEGAEAISRFLFNNPKRRRRVYYLADDARGTGKLPCFRLGNTICARKSKLRSWIAEREGNAAPSANLQKVDEAPRNSKESGTPRL